MARRVSFVEWIQGRSKFKQIILQGHGAYAELTKSYVEGIVGVVSAMVNSVEMTDDPDRKIWFIADEFAQMGKMPVRPLFEVGRSRGVRCVVACQDFAQLEEIHGAPMVKALVGMCGTLLVGQIMQGETAEQLCKAFGSREVERRNTPLSGSGTAGASSFSREEVPLYKPSELTSRLGLAEDGSGVVLLLFTGGRAYELRWPIYKMRSERPPHVPAPWTLGGGAAWSRLPISAGSASTTAVVSADFDTREEQSELLAQSSQLSVAPVAETRKAEGGDEAIDGLGAHGVEREGKGTAKPDEEQTALWRAEDSIASRNERLSDASSSFDAPQTKNKECAAGAATLLANESFLERADHFGRDPEAHFDAAAELAALGLALGQRESSDMGNGEA